MIRVWGAIPHITGWSAPDIVNKDCDNVELHDWHFYIEGDAPFYCPGPYKSFGETYPLCQIGTDIAKVLPCKHRESGGKRCERIESHGDDGHRFGRHTIAHEQAGNGHSCAHVEEILKKYDAGLLTDH